MYLLFDIGATKIRLAVSRDGKSFETPEIIETPDVFEDALDAVVAKAKDISSGEHIDVVAGDIAAPLINDKKHVGDTPNLRWENKPIVEELHRRFNGAKILIENDADLIGLGEATVGAGRGKKIVVYYTISTGVGGARIVNGKIDMHAVGFEPGHQIIDAGGALCRLCGPQGDLEAYVGGASIEARYGMKPTDIKDPQAWDDFARWLAYGLNNSIIHWSPDVVVIGGGLIIHEKGIDIAKVKKYLTKTMHIFPTIPEIKKATLGDFGGLHGALELIRQNQV